MSREQAHARLDAERERESRLGVQYWPIFLRETGEFAGVCRAAAEAGGFSED